MKKIFFASAIALSVIAQPLLAQELIPATSEDIQEFDRQVSQHMKKARPAKATKSNFGAAVSEEAKKLKASDSKEDFGKWVSGQRRKSDENRPSAEGSLSNGKGGSLGSGNSANAPGRSGEKKGKNK